jgi:hypothetical protein
MTTDVRDFPAKYSALMLKVWDSPDEIKRLEADPIGELKTAGIEVPPKAIVNIVRRNLDRNAKLADQLALWEQGIRSGVFDIIIPIRPDGDVTLVAEGGDPCCCCPCSCC